MPADGGYGYHFVRASFDLRAWMLERDADSGYARGRSRLKDNESRARETRRKVMDMARAEGDHATAERLALPSASGYPSVGDMEILSGS